MLGIERCFTVSVGCVELSEEGMGQMEGQQPVVRRVGLHDSTPCFCENDCPGAPSCICVVIWDNSGSHGMCYCDCGGGVPGPIPETLPNFELDQKIDLSARDAPLSRLGLVLASKCTADIFVPALDLDRPVTLSLRGVTAGTAIREAGLIARDRAD